MANKPNGIFMWQMVMAKILLFSTPKATHQALGRKGTEEKH
jgi:hypothetical protein